MEAFRRRVTRDVTDSDVEGPTPTMVNLLISLLVLVLLGITLVGALLVLRRRRQDRKLSELPLHNGPCVTTHNHNHNRFTISAAPGKHESVFVYDEKRTFLEASSSPPSGAVPEIRITFPEEEDESGKRKSGRVVVVRISEHGGVGLEPCREEELPPYQSTDSGRFQSLDLERMGGLKEKEEAKRWS
ncbi:hypothetical protein VTN02DRAFT_6222 [Thermoascus thermophilus]